MPGSPRGRVLDAGCGPGSVSLLAAKLVAPAGWVVGVDRNQAMPAAGRERARAILPGSLSLRSRGGTRTTCSTAP
jgi:ubiquinone/menaquinone biosynthesis C-methylase UbiE